MSRKDNRWLNDLVARANEGDTHAPRNGPVLKLRDTLADGVTDSEEWRCSVRTVSQPLFYRGAGMMRGPP